MKKIVLFLTIIILILLTGYVCAEETGDSPYGGGNTNPNLPWDPSGGNWEDGMQGMTTDNDVSTGIPIIILIIIGFVVIAVPFMIIMLVLINRKKAKQAEQQLPKSPYGQN